MSFKILTQLQLSLSTVIF